MLKNTILLFATLLFLFSSGCSAPVEMNQDNELSTETSEEDAHHKEMTEEKDSEEGEGAKSVTLKRTQEKPFNYESTSILLDSSCGEARDMLAPSYITDEGLYFVHSLENETVIKVLSFESNECEILYHAEGIGMMTGADGDLYFTEYDTANYSNIDYWEIVKLNPDTGVSSVIREGSSLMNTTPPVLRVGENRVNWIEYSAEDDESVLVSTIVEYHLGTEEISAALSEKLQVTKDIQGVEGNYLSLQKGSTADGILVDTSTFVGGNKTMGIKLYAENSEPKLLSSLNQVYDFDFSNGYFSVGSEGFWMAESIRTPKSTWLHKTSEPLTFDSTFALGDQKFLYRYSMNELFISDVEAGTYYSLTGHQPLVSKPLVFGSKIIFAHKDEEENTYFNVVLW